MNGWILCSCGGHAFDRCCSCWAPICAGHATLADEKRTVALPTKVVAWDKPPPRRTIEIDLYTCPECTAQRQEAAQQLEVPS